MNHDRFRPSPHEHLDPSFADRATEIAQQIKDSSVADAVIRKSDEEIRAQEARVEHAEYAAETADYIRRFTGFMQEHDSPGAHTIELTTEVKPRLIRNRPGAAYLWRDSTRRKIPKIKREDVAGWELGSNGIKNKYSILTDGRIIKNNPKRHVDNVDQSPNKIFDPSNPDHQADYFKAMTSIGFKTPEDMAKRLDTLVGRHVR